MVLVKVAYQEEVSQIRDPWIPFLMVRVVEVVGDLNDVCINGRIILVHVEL